MWNRQAEGGIEHNGEIVFRRPRVFCASLADWLDEEVPVEWLVNLLETIHATPHLDWLLLTKRPENFQSRMDEAFQFGELNCDRHVAFINALGAWSQVEREHAIAWENIWIGTTVEDQQRADQRIPLLLGIPAKVRFLSCEPLLGPVDIQASINLLPWQINPGPAELHWIICGGESGQNARPMMHGWATSLRDQCQAAGVPFLFKQWGEWGPTEPVESPLADMLAPGMQRIGKKAAGRQLDGREWNEFPNL
jgi:protein gp37